jgi:hypothetical protein
MGIVKKEDIAGYQRGDGTIVCTVVVIAHLPLKSHPGRSYHEGE